MRALAILTTLILLGACTTRPDPAPAPPAAPLVTRPAPRPTAPPPPTPSVSWEDASATAGDWAYRRDGRGSIALFGSPGADAVFAIRCDAAQRRIYLTRAGQLPATVAGTMTVRASNGLQSFPASNTGGGAMLVGAEVEPGNAHLDAMAFSRGKFLVSVSSMSDLVIPSWPEFGRVVEDCRS